MPGYIDELLRMLGQAQVPPGVTRSMAPPGMSGMDMEGEALRQALAPPSRPQPTMDELLDEQNAAELRRMVEMSMELNPFYDATPYKQVLGPNASQTTGVPVPVTRDNPMAYGNGMQMPAQDMEPANMDIRSLLAALAGAGGGFAAGRLTAPQHTMPDGAVMPGASHTYSEMYDASGPGYVPQEPEDLTHGGERVPGSMAFPHYLDDFDKEIETLRIPMPPPYKTPPQLQKLNNLRMP